MKVYSQNTMEIVTKYVGDWYDGQCFPQNLCVLLDSEDKSVCIVEQTPRGGVPSKEWHEINLTRKLPLGLYSLNECEYILEQIKPITDKLFDSYEERYNGNNYVGSWDEELILELEKALMEFTESDLEFDCDNHFDESEFEESNE